MSLVRLDGNDILNGEEFAPFFFEVIHFVICLGILG